MQIEVKTLLSIVSAVITIMTPVIGFLARQFEKYKKNIRDEGYCEGYKEGMYEGIDIQKKAADSAKING